MGTCPHWTSAPPSLPIACVHPSLSSTTRYPPARTCLQTWPLPTACLFSALRCVFAQQVTLSLTSPGTESWLQTTQTPDLCLAASLLASTLWYGVHGFTLECDIMLWCAVVGCCDRGGCAGVQPGSVRAVARLMSFARCSFIGWQ